MGVDTHSRSYCSTHVQVRSADFMLCISVTVLNNRKKAYRRCKFPNWCSIIHSGWTYRFSNISISNMITKPRFVSQLKIDIAFNFVELMVGPLTQKMQEPARYVAVYCSILHATNDSEVKVCTQVRSPVWTYPKTALRPLCNSVTQKGCRSTFCNN